MLVSLAYAPTDCSLDAIADIFYYNLHVLQKGNRPIKNMDTRVG